MEFFPGLLSLSLVGFLHVITSYGTGKSSCHGRFTEQFLESHPGYGASFTGTGGFPNAATSSLKRVTGRIFKICKCFRGSKQDFVFHFLHYKAAKKTWKPSAHKQKGTDTIFRTFNKLFISCTVPFNNIKNLMEWTRRWWYWQWAAGHPSLQLHPSTQRSSLAQDAGRFYSQQGKCSDSTSCGFIPFFVCIDFPGVAFLCIDVDVVLRNRLFEFTINKRRPLQQILKPNHKLAASVL